MKKIILLILFVVLCLYPALSVFADDGFAPLGTGHPGQSEPPQESGSTRVKPRVEIIVTLRIVWVDENDSDRPEMVPVRIRVKDDKKPRNKAVSADENWELNLTIDKSAETEYEWLRVKDTVPEGYILDEEKTEGTVTIWTFKRDTISTEEPTEAVVEAPADAGEIETEEPAEETTEEAPAEADPKSSDDPTAEGDTEETGEPAEEPSEEPTEEAPADPDKKDEPTEEPAEEPTEEPAEEPTEEPTEEPAEEPTEEPTEDVTEVTADPIPQDVDNPKKESEPTAEPEEQKVTYSLVIEWLGEEDEAYDGELTAGLYDHEVAHYGEETPEEGSLSECTLSAENGWTCSVPDLKDGAYFWQIAGIPEEYIPAEPAPAVVSAEGQAEDPAPAEGEAPAEDAAEEQPEEEPLQKTVQETVKISPSTVITLTIDWNGRSKPKDFSLTLNVGDNIVLSAEDVQELTQSINKTDSITVEFDPDHKRLSKYEWSGEPVPYEWIAEGISMDDLTVEVTENVNDKGVPEKSVKWKMETGLKRFFNKHSTEVFIGVCAAAVVGGGVAISSLTRKNKKEKPVKPGTQTAVIDDSRSIQNVRNTTAVLQTHGTYYAAGCLGQGKRDYQEDSLWYPDNLQPGSPICAVIADGMGGMENGAESSQRAVAKFEKTVAEIQNEWDIPSKLWKIAGDINAEVYAVNTQKSMNGGCTLVVAYIKENQFYWLSVGDSRIYLIRDGILSGVNEEHELENRMYAGLLNGQLDLADIRDTQERELRKLTSNIGRASIPMIDQNFVPFQLRRGDKLLLCSDGVSGTLSDEEILQCLNTTDPAADCANIVNAIEKKNKRGQDNYSAIVIYCAKED